MSDPIIAPEDQIVYEDEFKGPSKEERVLGACCYAPGGFILPYVLEQTAKPFVLFHIKQGFALFALLLLLSLFPIWGTSWLAFFLYLIFGSWHAYKAYRGEMYQMKVVQKIFGKTP